MSILIERNTRLLTVGYIGDLPVTHSIDAMNYGTQFVGGVTPGKGGTVLSGFPVFNTVDEACKKTQANAAMIFVQPKYAADSILKCIDSEIPLIICVTGGIPIRDMLKIREVLNNSSSRMIGPASSGVITPGECKVGVMPGEIYMPGKVGVVSRSGTLSYEIVYQLTKNDVGQSTCVVLGGDPVLGSDFIDVLKMFESDPATEIVVLLGEIGGNFEIEAAKWIKRNMTKPVVGYVAGSMAPKEKVMGHDGVVVVGIHDSAEKKFEILEDCTVHILRSPDKVALKVKELLVNNSH